MSATPITAVVSIAALFQVPVADLERWTTLSFNGIPANDVSVSGEALRIAVDDSASPLVYRFDEPVTITGLSVSATWSGKLRIPAGATQGDEDADDFVLKLGLVESGSRRLNWLQRRIAADWVKSLFELAPPDSGVDRIHFLSTTRQRELVGQSRTHPLNDLLFETRIRCLDGPGPFDMKHSFEEPVTVLGLWISSDGDNTGSEFVLDIDSIVLELDASATAPGR